MSEKLDFRVQRTYKLLIGALGQLLDEKDFDNISVAELCERAMVRRATFYKHFSNKYEFFAFVIKEYTNKYITEQEIDVDYDDHAAYLTAIIEMSMGYAQMIKSILRGIFMSSGATKLTNIIYEALEARILRRLKDDEAMGYDLPCKPELLTPMISGLMGRVAYCIAFDNFEMSHEEVVKLVNRLINI